VSSSSPVNFFRLYNNTAVELVRDPSNVSGQGFAIVGPNIDDTYVYNNIEWESWSPNLTTYIRGYVFQDTAGREYVDYNLAYDPDGGVAFIAPIATQAHPRINQNPGLRDVASRDYTLAANSLAIRQGGPLTTVSGSGSGTTFNVVTGGGGFFFGDNTNISQYGGNLVVGDTITVGTDVLSVASVAGNAITVTTPFTWVSGEPVYFGSSATPDIGAYPYKSSGYALTAGYSRSGGTVTVTPSDNSLVRFVICYEDGIPTTVDNSAPFTCSVGSGTVDVRVYPLYASETSWVTVGGAALPAAPTNPKIIQ
jgi:hypothetical protein